MVSVKRVIVLLIVSLFLISMLLSTAVSAEMTDNTICTQDGSVVELGLSVIVYVSAFVFVIGGSYFTLANATKPTVDEYRVKRNKITLYSGSVLLTIYGINYLITEYTNYTISECLPFV